MKKIPYGMSDFKEINTNGYYYIDKTNFISKIENNSNFLFFLRPRRFGKSLLIATLESYYDRYYADEFEEIFQNSYILKNPTPLKNYFCIMRFDFSAVDVTDYEESFRVQLLNVIDNFVKRYSLNIEFKEENPINRLQWLFMFCSDKKIPIYILTDEYDNFVNKLLVTDMKSYKDLVTTKEAFYKQFFTMLKVGTSGSNIGANISMKKSFNDKKQRILAIFDKVV